MAAVSPALKVGLGLSVVAAVFTIVNGWGGDELITGETFEAPLALVDDSTTTPTSWEAPPVTRNPFASGEVTVDATAVEDLTDGTDETTETTVVDATPAEPTASTNSVITTVPALTLEETVSRRVPPGAPPVETTTPSQDGSSVTTSTAGGGGIQLEG